MTTLYLGIFTEAEFKQFTKTERRILAMTHELRYTEEQICRAQEIERGTLRVHLMNIRRKQAVMREARAMAQIAADEARMRAQHLPEMADVAPSPTPPELRRTAKSIKESRKNKHVTAPVPTPPPPEPTIAPKPLPRFITAPNPSLPAAPGSSVCF